MSTLVDVNSNNLPELSVSLADLKLDESENESLTKLKILLRKDDIFGRIDFENYFLIKFLRCRNNDPQKAYDNVINYIKAVQSKPHLFLFTQSTVNVLNNELHLILKSKTENGEGIIVLRPHRWNHKELPIDELFRLMYYNCELALLDPDYQKNGLHSIIDCSNISISMIYACGPTNAAYMSEITELILPLKIIKIHIVLQSRLVDFGYNLFKPFLHASFKEKIVFHGKSFGNLHSYLPASALPEFLGGSSANDYTVDERLQLYEMHKSKWEKYWNVFKNLKSDE